MCPTRIISETAPRIFPKPGMKLGVKNVRNVARPLFLRFWPVLAKAADLCEKKPFLAIFASFWDFAENPFRGFSWNFARMYWKIVLKDRTVVSPGRIRYFWDFGWSYTKYTKSSWKWLWFKYTRPAWNSKYTRPSWKKFLIAGARGVVVTWLLLLFACEYTVAFPLGVIYERGTSRQDLVPSILNPLEKRQALILILL